jgi:hypothetical protein
MLRGEEKQEWWLGRSHWRLCLSERRLYPGLESPLRPESPDVSQSFPSILYKLERREGVLYRQCQTLPAILLDKYHPQIRCRYYWGRGRKIIQAIR